MPTLRDLLNLTVAPFLVCAWCGSPLEPLAPADADDPVVVELGRLCPRCYEKEQRA